MAMENALSILHEKYFGHGNGEKTLQKNVMSKRHFRKMLCRHICTFAHLHVCTFGKMSCRHICTFAHLGKCHVVTFAHLHIWENEQQSVRLVISYRGKNEKSSFCLCVCHLKIIFSICICICIFVFFGGENNAKKKL